MLPLQIINMKDICQKCRKRDTCTEPCAPVEQFINQSGRPDLERPFGNDLLILHHRRNEKPISALLSGFESDLDKLKIEQLLSDQNSFAFENFEERLKQTKIFLLKLHGKSYQEIADYFEKTPDEIRNIYNTCRERFLNAIKLMDDRKKICNHAAAIVQRQEAKTGSIPAMKKQFLLSKLFGLTPREIAEILNLRTSTIMTNLKYYSEKNPEYFEECGWPDSSQVLPATR